MFEFARSWRQKTGVSGLLCSVVCAILRLAVFIKLRLVTDGRTDTGPQHDPSIYGYKRIRSRFR